MTKNVLKEIIIMLLLCLAIILVLGVLLYEYVPSNKVTPEKVSYVPSEQVQKDLQETVSLEDSQVILTYEVNSSDLKNYERVKNYKPGKVNPFSSYQDKGATKQEGKTSNSNSNNTQTTNNSNQNSNNTNNNNNKDQSSSQDQTTNNDGSFFPDKGTK